VIYLCVACVLALLYAEASDRRALRIAAKLGASAAFVVVGFCGHHDTVFAEVICAGLVLGALGDAALLARGSVAFLGGLTLFLAGHIAYAIAVGELLAPDRWFRAAGWLAALPLVGAAVALAYLWRYLGSMRAPVLAYVAAIAAMVLGALAAWRTGAVPGRFALGACLFFVSDLSVARDKFVAPGLANKLWGLPCYYAAQLLIASSL
jgi:uncharacterized membrane protein YhhN